MQTDRQVTLRTAVNMVSEQSSYEGNAQRKGKEVTLNQSATILQLISVPSLPN